VGNIIHDDVPHVWNKSGSNMSLTCNKSHSHENLEWVCVCVCII